MTTYSKELKALSETDVFKVFIATCQDKVEKATQGRHTLGVSIGRKYLKVTQRRPGTGHMGASAWCFVDIEGSILLPNGWDSPAKGSRGSITDIESYKGFDWTGPNYIRG